MFCENIHKEEQKMIVMDIKIDNFFAFKNFHMNMSYPKKIIDSTIKNEFLHERTNFRYKKVNILMGANATGKTSFGKMLMEIFNFISEKQFDYITEKICDVTKAASFSMDFIGEQYILYRISTIISPKSESKYRSTDINVSISSTEIGPRDSYESCVKRIDDNQKQTAQSYIEELEKVDGLSWLFSYPSNSQFFRPKNDSKYLQILERTLQALDPSIKKVEKLKEIENTYVIRTAGQDIIMQDGKFIDTDILSSGTKEGIEIAEMLAGIIAGNYHFYYCDEKFSYIHSDLEKAFLSVMIQSLGNDDQLFFTTHNTDILDLPLPKHSFMFLKKDLTNDTEPITCISASQYLKRNTDSLRNAVDNDLFSASPSVDLIYDIIDS